MAIPAPTAKANIGPVCLVTGGAGYLGTFIIRRLLARGYRVHSFDLQPCRIDDERITNFIGDIRSYDDTHKACTGVNTVFHTVAIINLLGLYRKKVRDTVVSINVSGTAQLLKAATDNGVQRFIYTSSNNVCFDHEIVMGDESIPYATRPLDLYTETKAMAEKLVLEADLNKTGMRAIAVRPGGIWGGDGGGIMISRFIKQLAAGAFKATLGDGSAQADNTHVENLVDAQMLAAEKLVTAPDRVGGEAYYITDEEPMNALEWFRPLVEELGFKYPTLRLPALPMYWAGFLAEVAQYFGAPEMPLTRMGVLKVVRSHSFKTDRARRELGYQPRYGRIEGLQEIVPHARELVASLQGKKRYDTEIQPTTTRSSDSVSEPTSD